jgi:hypothetical protein
MTAGGRAFQIVAKAEERLSRPTIEDGAMDRRGLRGRHVGKWHLGKRGDL